MGESSAPQSIINDINEIFLDTSILETHSDLKVKTSKAKNIKDNSLWDLLYESKFIIFLYGGDSTHSRS